MAQACASCGGTGYGSLDPEFGFRKGGPCPDCTSNIEARNDAGNEGVLELGPPPKDAPPEVTKSVDNVDGGNASPDEQGQTAQELVEAGVFSEDDVAESGAQPEEE